MPAGVSQLVEFGVAMELWRVHVRDFLVWLVAFVITTFAGVEIGLLSSIALSIFILVLEVAFPRTAVLGRLGKTNVYRCVSYRSKVGACCATSFSRPAIRRVECMHKCMSRNLVPIATWLPAVCTFARLQHPSPSQRLAPVPSPACSCTPALLTQSPLPACLCNNVDKYPEADITPGCVCAWTHPYPLLTLLTDIVSAACLPVNRNIDKYPEAETTPGLVVVRWDAPLFFANTAHFESSIKRTIREAQKEAREAGRE